MYIDLTDIILGGPEADRSMVMCSSCCVVYISKQGSCPSCCSRDGVPFLDRRPLLLSKEMYDGISDEIDRLGDMLGSMDEEEQDFVLNELGPLLSSFMDESRVAESRGHGYRVTGATLPEVLQLARNLCVPPTLVAP